MKKTFFIVAVALISTANLSAQQDSTVNLLVKQDYSNKFDLKIGSGLGFITWGDLLAVCFENEFNYKINKYFTVAVSFGIGRSIGTGRGEWKDHSDYLQGSVNAFVSPFRNNRRNNFRIGGGYTYINETTAYMSSASYYPPDETAYDITYAYDQNSSHCFNVIIEDEFKITPRILIGGKLFLTGNIDSAVLWGGMIKFGVVLSKI